jgi:hypothetical protein
MDGITYELSLFLFATFAGAFVAGLSGFAFGHFGCNVSAECSGLPHGNDTMLSLALAARSN